jgi:hypothetical protein
MSEAPRLDLAEIEAQYIATLLESDKRADGRRFIVGQENAALAVDVFPLAPPLVVVRSRGSDELLSMANVTSITTTTEPQGIRITNKQSECLVSTEGHIIFSRTPPPPPPKPFIEGRSVLRHDKDGVPYQQSTLDIEGSPEGERVRVRGMVKDAPKQEGKGKERPLVFFIEEVDEKNGVAVEHEVHATRKARAELTRKKLTGGDVIEVVMFRHTITVPTVNGEELTHTRHHLATITKVERKNAKRLNAGPVVEQAE